MSGPSGQRAQRRFFGRAAFAGRFVATFGLGPGRLRAGLASAGRFATRFLAAAFSGGFTFFAGGRFSTAGAAGGCSVIGGAAASQRLWPAIARWLASQA